MNEKLQIFDINQYNTIGYNQLTYLPIVVYSLATLWANVKNKKVITKHIQLFCVTLSQIKI